MSTQDPQSVWEIKNRSNLDNLRDKEYPGRAIIMGKNEEGNSFVTYILTGRSPSSKARTLEYDEKNRVTFTAPTDMSILEKGSPSLLLYPAIIAVDDKIAVSNGIHTNLIYSQLMKPFHCSPEETLDNALGNSVHLYDHKLGMIDITSYEPDEPNDTPRISGCIVKQGGALSIVRNNGSGGRQSNYHGVLFKDTNNGESNLIMTYDGVDTGKEPLRPFGGATLDLKLTGNEREISEKVRAAINQDTFISLATQFAVEGSEPYIINLNGQTNLLYQSQELI